MDENEARLNYTLIENFRPIRQKFTNSFIAPYSQLLRSHKDRSSRLRTDYSESFMFMWERLDWKAHIISFDDAIRLLKGMWQEVFFLTESLNSFSNQFCKLDNREEYVAVAPAAQVAECAAYEWYTEYALAEQGYYLTDAILPSELYIFDDTFSWCVILTHETDETGSADSRVCLLIGDKQK